MFKKTSKLIGLFILLLLSFIYTDKVFTAAKKKDPVMKKVIVYKKENDISPIEPVIKKDEIALGVMGNVVDERASYRNMKNDDKFSENKIIYKDKRPNMSINNNYEYYIKRGNPSNNKISVIFKVKNKENLNSMLKSLSKLNADVSFFIDGAFLENNIEEAFSIINLGSSLYNLGYDGVYSRSMINVTNNLIESISLKDSLFCLNEDKNEEYKKACMKKKMYSIAPELVNPSLIEVKKNLKNGLIISYDLDSFDIKYLKVLFNSITSRGYSIDNLSNVINEKKTIK